MKKLSSLIFFYYLSLPSFSQNLNSRVDSLLNSYYASRQPGAMVAILYQGKLAFEKGYGLSDLNTRTNIDATTNFNIGSLTKQFTAYSILQLIKENKLSLDDKLIKFFPDFNANIGNRITIREMLTHSSGLIDHYEFTDTLHIKHATDKDVLHAVIQLDTSYFQAGTHYRYSNTAYCLLGLIIEKLSGLSYGDYLRKNVFGPLTMNHSTVLKIGEKIFKKASGYEYENTAGKDYVSFRKSDAENSIFFSTEADGGIYTTMEDYLKWITNLQNGSILDRSLVEQASSPQFVIDTLRKLAYGYGWFISSRTENKAVYHTGSNGGFRAISFSIPSLQYSVIIFSNRTGVDLESLVEKINNLFNVNNKSFTKIESLVSFISSWPNFAPCKEIPLFSTSFKRN